MSTAALAASTSALGGDAQAATVIARPRAIARNLTMTGIMCLSSFKRRINGLAKWLPVNKQLVCCELLRHEAASAGSRCCYGWLVAREVVKA